MVDEEERDQRLVWHASNELREDGEMRKPHGEN